jgi:hypothetical protein
MENNEFKVLSFDDAKKINGGFIDPVCMSLGACAALLYCYEWGYNYAYKRPH